MKLMVLRASEELEMYVNTKQQPSGVCGIETPRGSSTSGSKSIKVVLVGL